MKFPYLAGIIAGFFLSCFAMASAPALAAGAEPALQTTLDNGMRVVILPGKLAPIATTVLTYGVGSNDDTLPGIAHATEHMMFRGTKDISAAQFAIITARAGAEYNAETTQLYTQYWFKLAAAYAPLALRLEADRMTGASIAADAWQTERPAIEQEVRAHESVPGASIQAKVLKATFGDTPYAHSPVGTIEGFNRMKATDIAAFYRKWYRPNNATLVVSGNVDPQKILAEIHRDFDAIPKGDVPAHPSISLQPLSAQTIRDTISELPIPIAALTYRYPTLRSPDFRRCSSAADRIRFRERPACAAAAKRPDSGRICVFGRGPRCRQPGRCGAWFTRTSPGRAAVAAARCDRRLSQERFAAAAHRRSEAAHSFLA